MRIEPRIVWPATARHRLWTMAAGAPLVVSLFLTGCGNSGATEAGVASIYAPSPIDETHPAIDPADEPSSVTEPAPEKRIAEPSDPPPSADDDYRKQIIGKWRQDNSEKRTITVSADGTATIVAELNDYRQYIVGKLLRFDLEWTLNDGTLTFVTLGGDPPESIKYINAIYGKSRSYRLREFTPERLLPEKVDTGEIEPEWTRIADNAAPE